MRSALLALALYAVLATGYSPLWQPSPYPYYNYLADALLHGQLPLRLVPPVTHDLVLYGGQYYLYWPPMPAVLLIPFVALFGVGFSDILFTLGIAALNVALVALLLRAACARSLIRLSPTQRAALVLFFALGTVHVTLAPLGRVWFTGQLVGFAFVALAYLAALRLRGWPAFALLGLATAGAMLTRNHLLFAGLWPAWYLLSQHKGEGWRRLLGYCFVGALPVALAGGLFAIYNLGRFGGVLDVGLDHHLMSTLFAGDYALYGAFSPHYLLTNVFYQFLAYPFALFPPGSLLMGGSLFLLSPVFFAAFWGAVKGRPRGTVLLLIITIVAVDLPILFLMGTGWVQFGPRYTLDFTVPLLLLTALGVEHWSGRALRLLTAVSVAHYLVGSVILVNALRLSEQVLSR